jgi:hypothetical protein
MARPELSRRVGKSFATAAVGDGRPQRREFHEALLDAGSFENLPAKWQAAIVAAEQARPNLRVVRDA